MQSLVGRRRLFSMVGVAAVDLDRFWRREEDDLNGKVFALPKVD